MANGIEQFTINTQAGATREDIDVTVAHCGDCDGDGNELDDVQLRFRVADNSYSGTEDITGVAFNLGSTSNLQITGGNQSEIVDNGIPPGTLNWGFMGFGRAGPFDAAVGYDNQGGTSVREVSFCVSSTDDTNISAQQLLNGQAVYVRLQSTDGGEESAKTTGTLVASDCEEDNGNGTTFEFDNAISNLVAYLDCDETPGADTKVKLDGWSELEPTEVKEIELADIQAWLDSTAFGDCDLLGLTVKAGNNTDPDYAFHSGEGTLVYGDYNDLTSQEPGLPLAGYDAEIAMTEEIYNEYFAADMLMV